MQLPWKLRHDTRIEMQELLLKIQNDSTLMLMAGLALVVLLVILLVIVVSAMKVKKYLFKPAR